MTFLYTLLVCSSLVILEVAHCSASSQHLNSTHPFIIQPRVQRDPSCRCGQKGDSRIVGGNDAQINEWPWQAAIMDGRKQFCGGSLINDRYILTAAHCTQGLRPRDITVRLAEHRLSTAGETSLVTRDVKKIIDHRNYIPGDEINDISLLQLSSPVEMSSTVVPVCMPPPNPRYTNKMATITGWGDTSDGGPASDVLKEVTVKVMSNAACRRLSYGSAIKKTMLCAAGDGKDSCQGDSGGPLVFMDGGGNYDQIGVVSWGYGCAEKGYPGVYTRVNEYLNWIRANAADGIYCKGSAP
ncbi:trypsin-1-like [Palaemon carinicauda]|uniref:trypsin-1-like n=1 Tax=Palaemon carinicauda TaxID=392227 RepID=UPI0035B6490A